MNLLGSEKRKIKIELMNSKYNIVIIGLVVILSIIAGHIVLTSSQDDEESRE